MRHHDSYIIWWPCSCMRRDDGGSRRGPVCCFGLLETPSFARCRSCSVVAKIRWGVFRIERGSTPVNLQVGCMREEPLPRVPRYK